MRPFEYFQYVVEQIHTVIVATVDDAGHPVTAAIDMMDYDSEGIYFLTARGKGFYNRLKNNEWISFTALKGESTMTSIALSIQGRTVEVGPAYLERLFKKNPYMEQIYPTKESQQALTVFKIVEGSGEWFDLSKKPIERDSFHFGNTVILNSKYTIHSNCIGCFECVKVCPQQCINTSTIPFVIDDHHCLHCGICMEKCPSKAIERVQYESK